MRRILFTGTLCFFVSVLVGQSIMKEYNIENQYINIPIDMQKDRQLVYFVSGNDTLTYSVIRIADGEADYWVFKDVSDLKGKTLKLVFSEKTSGIDLIYQSDRFAGQDSLYHETKRPQFHFTSRRGWNNDPNGLVYYDGEYHLFYQHNPYEIYWENMHWGHAVSKDLMHWKELNDALYPDKQGTMFSGSAVIDKYNTGGWSKDALVALYTAAGERMTQNVAYSTDRGRTFTKYTGNPILGPNRDPKVFWYEPDKKWVMVLYEDNFFAIYNSTDLIDWEFKSRTKGFYECPELFELAIDGDENNKKWVMYGASGTYMIGNFDGENFTPEHGKYFYSWGSQYAAQTYNNNPDGRRIQIGWGRIEQPGMPFNQMMLFPCELTLRSTDKGIRLFCEPISEIQKLHKKKYFWKNLSGEEANEYLKEINTDLLHARMDIEIIHGLGLEVHFRGKPVIYYDGNFNRFNGAPYSSDKPGSMRFTIEILIDKTSLECYIDDGKLFISEGLKKPVNKEGFQIKGDVKIHTLEVYEMKSIWQKENQQ
ncbi:MAG: glycoside hydrolase family 32 protein [Bacteroidota bacterium]|nr:glycoside hydrolase family 32 protein [Bacteroidota bacterium]